MAHYDQAILNNFDDVQSFGDEEVIYELFSGLQMELSPSRIDAAPALKPLGRF